MPYCPECGEEIDPDAKFCKSCGSSLSKTTRLTTLASWGQRFIAYIIDIIILGILFAFIRLPRFALFRGAPHWIPLLDLGAENALYFIYFTFMEFSYGQSIGKMALKIRVQHISGRPVEIVEAAIESFGKSFLLPLDLIIGWILYPDKNQRLFNNLSSTVVVEEERRLQTYF